MTTDEIEAIANEEGLVVGSSDMDIKKRLRLKVIPTFEMDVGECAWRRKNDTLAFAIGDRQKDLPADFGKLLDGPVFRGSDGTAYIVEYIGEDIVAMAQSALATEQSIPFGYWFVRNGGNPNVLRTLRLNCPVKVTLAAAFSYISRIQFPDNTTSVNLSNYIPTELQWALVEGLRIEILRGRVSISDSRFMDAREEYQRYVSLAQEYREPGMREAVKRVRSGTF